MPNLFITADDYGPVPFINVGVETALRHKCINTVSVLMNPHSPNDTSIAEKIISLHNKYPWAHFGVHLSITSGMPALPPQEVKSLLKNESQFQAIHEFDFEKVKMDELKKELKAQIDLFPIDKVPLHHISSHHGILALFKPFFKILASLSNDYQVPMRQPIPISKMKIKGFRCSLMKKQGIFTAIKLVDDVEMKNLIAALKHMKKLEDLLDNEDIVNYPPVPYFVDSYYRSASQRKLNKIFKYLPKDGDAEMVVHLGNGPQPQEVPNGIKLEHFDDRNRELEVLLHVKPGPMERYINDYGWYFG